MSKKLLVIAVILGAVACWYFGSYRQHSNGASAGGSDLPRVRVDESRLSEAGRRFFADTKRRIEALRKDATNTKLKFEGGLFIADDLRLLGDYRSAAEWYLRLIDWYEELSPEDRRPSKYSDPDAIPSDATLDACVCFFFIGENGKGFETMERFIRRYPNHPARPKMVEFYNFAKEDLAAFLEGVSFMGANRKFLE